MSWWEIEKIIYMYDARHNYCSGKYGVSHKFLPLNPRTWTHLYTTELMYPI